MDVLLVRDVSQLGKRGQRVTVKPGYARNYLLPMGFAIPATAENIRQIDRVRVKWLAEEAKLLEEMRELAGHLEKIETVRIVEKASETGHLYGSVTDKMVADAVTAKGIEIEPRVVVMEAPFKEVGDYPVTLRLHEEVSVPLKVEVRMEGNEDWLPGQEEAEEGTEAAAEAPTAPEGDVDED